MAGSLNKVMLIGRLGSDPKLSYTPSGSAVANFNIATDETYVKDGQKVEKTEWHRIVVWNKQAEFCANYLRKGSLIFVEGSLRTRQWEDQQGQTKYTTEIIAQRVQGLDKRQGGDMPEGEESQPQQRQAAKPQPRGRAQPRPSDEEPGPAFPSEASGMDDVPF